jgi:hypothetical protein
MEILNARLNLSDISLSDEATITFRSLEGLMILDSHQHQREGILKLATTTIKS